MTTRRRLRNLLLAIRDALCVFVFFGGLGLVIWLASKWPAIGAPLLLFVILVGIIYAHRDNE